MGKAIAYGAVAIKILTALYPADWAGFEPDSNQSENVIPVSIDRAGIQGSVKAGKENSVIPNNIPELTRIFPGTTQFSILKVDSGETSTGQMAHPSVSPSQITVKKPSVIRRC